MGPGAADPVLVLGDVGEVREIAEGADDLARLGARQPVHDLAELAPRGFVLVAAEPYRGLAGLFDDVEDALALLLAHGVAKNPTEQPGVLAQRPILVAIRRYRHGPPSVTLFGFGGDLVVGDDRYVLPLQAEAKANERDDQVAECNRRRIADAERGPVDEPEKRQHRTRAGIDRRALEPAGDDARRDRAEDQPGEDGAAAEQLHPAIDDARAGELGHPNPLRLGSRRAERPLHQRLTPPGDTGQER